MISFLKGLHIETSLFYLVQCIYLVADNVKKQCMRLKGVNTWRLLKLEVNDAFMNMAIDEAIMHARIANEVPDTLRFYSWKPSAVSIGRFQKAENEVNLEYCRKAGIYVVRRISGGGAVYHDAEGEVTYSVVAKPQNLGAKDLGGVLASLCSYKRSLADYRHKFGLLHREHK